MTEKSPFTILKSINWNNYITAPEEKRFEFFKFLNKLF